MIEKECIICHKIKPLDDYYVHRQMGDGHLNKCKECCKEYARNHDTREYDKHRHRYNPKRFLQHKYIAIKGRCTRMDPLHHYYGKPFLSKDEWEEWCQKTYPTFMSLYTAWQDSGFQQKYSPSIDRIDSTKGYTKDNIQWLTHSANCHKYNKSGEQIIYEWLHGVDRNKFSLFDKIKKCDICGDGFIAIKKSMVTCEKEECRRKHTNLIKRKSAMKKHGSSNKD